MGYDQFQKYHHHHFVSCSNRHTGSFPQKLRVQLMPPTLERVPGSEYTCDFYIEEDGMKTGLRALIKLATNYIMMNSGSE